MIVQPNRIWSDFVLRPRCPRFPDLSVALGRLSGWFFGFALWFALPLGPFRAVVFMLCARQDAVEWCRAPLERRLVAGAAVMALPMALFAVARRRAVSMN